VIDLPSQWVQAAANHTVNQDLIGHLIMCDHAEQYGNTGFEQFIKATMSQIATEYA
jgi:hypothetical protein